MRSPAAVVELDQRDRCKSGNFQSRQIVQADACAQRGIEFICTQQVKYGDGQNACLGVIRFQIPGARHARCQYGDTAKQAYAGCMPQRNFHAVHTGNRKQPDQKREKNVLIIPCKQGAAKSQIKRNF